MTPPVRSLLQLVQNQVALPPRPKPNLSPGARTGEGTRAGGGALAWTRCRAARHLLVQQRRQGTDLSGHRRGTHTVPSLKSCTRAGTGCGSCVSCWRSPEDRAEEGGRRGQFAPVRALPAHAPGSLSLGAAQAEVVRTVCRSMAGKGCEICKPAVASILASAWNEHVPTASMCPCRTRTTGPANIQRDGTYSVVPRVPAGEITPDQLIAIGGRRSDTGCTADHRRPAHRPVRCRLEHLPQIWGELIRPGSNPGTLTARRAHRQVMCRRHMVSLWRSDAVGWRAHRAPLQGLRVPTS